MDEMKKIPQRSEIAEADKWNIADLYPSDEAWEADLKLLEQSGDRLSSYAGKLSESADTLLAYLTEMEETNAKAELLGNYCMRRADEDTRVAKYQAMRGQFMNVYVSLGAKCSFETPEIMAISDEKLDEYYAEQPGLERYRRYLTDLRRRRAHTLSPAEEKLLAAAGEMAGTPDDIYGAFVDADIAFPDAVDANGEKHPLTQGTFITCEESPDRVLRKSAYENLYNTFASYKNTAAAILNAQGKQLKFFADARKYPGTLEASLDNTQVPTSVYLNLIEAVHQNMDKMHRYVRLRKKLLGVDQLHFYDIYTPLLADVDKKIPYSVAKQTVYDSLAPLGEDYRKVLKEALKTAGSMSTRTRVNAVAHIPPVQRSILL